MGSGEICAPEHGAVHLDPTQIERREISPREIGRCEVRTVALVIFRLKIQPMARQHLFDLVSRKHANRWPGRKVGESGKG